jgi:hypothetical protein
VGNPVINYYNAVLEADIPCYPKMALLVLVKNMNYHTRQTYVGTKKIAKQMGASYNTARRALDALEKEHKLIKFVGMHLIHPGSADATQIFEILIKPVPYEDTSTLSGYNPPPSHDTSTLRGRQSIQSGASTDSGVDLSGVDVVSEKAHANTHSDPDALSPDSLRSNKQSETTPKPRSASSRVSPSSTQPEYTETPEPPGTLREGDPSHESSAAPGFVPFTDTEACTLVNIWRFLIGENQAGTYDTLMKYRGPFSSRRLAFLMFYAMRISKFWSKKENWYALDIDNFLGASRKLDGEIVKWRQHDKLYAKFQTAADMEVHLMPEMKKREPHYQHGHTFMGGFSEVCETCGISYTEFIEKPETERVVCPNPSLEAAKAYEDLQQYLGATNDMEELTISRAFEID